MMLKGNKTETSPMADYGVSLGFVPMYSCFVHVCELIESTTFAPPPPILVGGWRANV